MKTVVFEIDDRSAKALTHIAGIRQIKTALLLGHLIEWSLSDCISNPGSAVWSRTWDNEAEAREVAERVSEKSGQDLAVMTSQNELGRWEIIQGDSRT